jgi:DNA polymerase-3 subunit beta
MLTGVRFDGGVMASTDRFRLSCITYDSHGFDALVPGAVLRAFASGDTVVNVEPGTVGADAKWVRISSGGRSVLARQLDCEFPKYRQLIPTELPVQAMIRRDELLGAIGDSEHVTLTLRHDDTMLVCAASRDGDMEVEQEISAPLLGDGELPFTVRLNSKNLAGCLKGTSAGVLKFAATTSSRPVVLTGAGDGDLHLVMPVRIAG